MDVIPESGVDCLCGVSDPIANKLGTFCRQCGGRPPPSVDKAIVDRIARKRELAETLLHREIRDRELGRNGVPPCHCRDGSTSRPVDHADGRAYCATCGGETPRVKVPTANLCLCVTSDPLRLNTGTIICKSCRGVIAVEPTIPKQERVTDDVEDLWGDIPIPHPDDAHTTLVRDAIGVAEKKIATAPCFPGDRSGPISQEMLDIRTKVIEALDRIYNLRNVAKARAADCNWTELLETLGEMHTEIENLSAFVEATRHEHGEPES